MSRSLSVIWSCCVEGKCVLFLFSFHFLLSSLVMEQTHQFGETFDRCGRRSRRRSGRRYHRGLHADERRGPPRGLLHVQHSGLHLRGQ